MKRRASVGGRLALLLACQTALAALLVLLALRSIYGIASDARHMYEFQLRSIADIGDALETAATLPEGQRSDTLDGFYERYRREWETAGGTSPNAIRFRADLARAGEVQLPALEAETLADLEAALRSGRSAAVLDSLANLQEINTRYADLEYQYVVQRTRRALIWMLAVGIGSTVLILLLGLHVHRAIAPRIHLLVKHVRQFREFGTYERAGDMGTDDIGMLANALDAGFMSIAEREREREEFLQIAAHELKTPVTSIRGYASLVVSHPEQIPMMLRALETINRQSWRLSRLIDGLFLALRARSRKLQFEPRPFDMSALINRVLDEMRPFVSEKTLASKIQGNVSILGDEALLGHALWSLLACAVALSSEHAPVLVALRAEEWRARLTVDIEDSGVSIPEVEELFLPFRSVEYETKTSPRLAIGLYLCREIVRIHNGELRIQQISKGQPEFVMELPL
jgi:signal transduction histidine kinase